MKFQYVVSAALALSLTATACSEEPLPSVSEPDAVESTAEASSTVPAPVDTSTIDQVDDVVDTTTTTEEPPPSLAFASSSDIGRLFEVEVASQALRSPGGDEDGIAIEAGALVQATRAQNSAGVLWVLVRSSELQTVGWLEASTLRPTTRSIDFFEADNAGQFQQVSSSIPGDELPLYREPDGSAPSGALLEGEIVMHGGNTVLAASGTNWVDIIDPATNETLGWVDASSVRPVSGNQVRTDSHAEVSRRTRDDVTYGATLSPGVEVAVGCNATQIQFSNSNTSLGLAIIVGTSAPVGRQTSAGITWASAGGSKLYAGPGESIVFTMSRSSSRTWYFAGLDEAGQAATNGATNDDGDLLASSVQEFSIGASSCAYVAPVEPVPDSIPEPDPDSTNGAEGADSSLETDGSAVAPDVTEAESSESTPSTTAAPLPPGPSDTSTGDTTG